MRTQLAISESAYESFRADIDSARGYPAGVGTRAAPTAGVTEATNSTLTSVSAANGTAPSADDQGQAYISPPSRRSLGTTTRPNDDRRPIRRNDRARVGGGDFPRRDRAMSS